ncbi:MAG: ferrous iron transport protein B [Nitrospirae bacterium]|nr:ferrous iron transport protein B [Nitrospirota bacterium]
MQHRHRHGHEKDIEKIALLGNPNVGKSVIFGLLTGKYVTVSNYPGTTVEITRSSINLNKSRYLLIDTPGVNSLVPMSEDEKVTRDILLNEEPSNVVQVGDAKNLKRTLLITIQLAEMGMPSVLALNMADEATEKGISIDIGKLKEFLGIEVVSTIAPQRKGIRELKEAMLKPNLSAIRPKYHPSIEYAAADIADLLPHGHISKKSLALMILSGDCSLMDWMKDNLAEPSIGHILSIKDNCEAQLKGSTALHINKARLQLAEKIADSVTTKTGITSWKPLAVAGNLSMHQVYGIPILLAVLYAVYLFVGVFGAGTLVDFFEETIFGQYINPSVTKLAQTFVPWQLLQDLLVGQYGIVTVALTYALAIILPITITFFIAFGLLEDSGYLPRLAIMSNRFFNLMGLNGKAVLPMVLGLGCGTMAIMTTRILETKRDRIITTFLLALAIPCSAQLGVILGMLGALSIKAAIIWTSCIIIVLFISGFLASKIVIGGKTNFFLEIPPIRIPNIMNIIIKTIGRVEWYLKEAVPLFILGTLILFTLNELDLIKRIEAAASPIVVNLLSLPQETTSSFIMGFLRRDYGAAGLFDLSQKGLLTPVQSIVSLVTITLFVPCLASFFMIIKEMGIKTALVIITIVFTLAIIYGSTINLILNSININL